jgi:hypothetical protein
MPPQNECAAPRAFNFRNGTRNWNHADDSEAKPFLFSDDKRCKLVGKRWLSMFCDNLLRLTNYVAQHTRRVKTWTTLHIYDPWLWRKCETSYLSLHYYDPCFTYSPYVGNPHASGAATYRNALPAAHIWIALEFLIIHCAVITDRRVFWSDWRMTNNLVGHRRISSSVGSLCMSYYRIQPLKEYSIWYRHFTFWNSLT